MEKVGHAGTVFRVRKARIRTKTRAQKLFLHMHSLDHLFCMYYKYKLVLVLILLEARRKNVSGDNRPLDHETGSLEGREMRGRGPGG